VRTGRETADLSTPLRSGRDDKFVRRKLPIIQWVHTLPWLNKFVISTGAHPDFLLTALDITTCAAFIKESRMKLTSATNLNRKSGVAEWRDLRFPFGSHIDFKALIRPTLLGRR
jgi:hypothetical protein